MTANVNTLSSSTGAGWYACLRTFTSRPALGMRASELRGYGIPLSKGKMFGCWSAWSAVKYPVGRMSASSRRDESEKDAIEGWEGRSGDGRHNEERPAGFGDAYVLSLTTI